MKALSDKARDQSVGKPAHWAAVGNIERLCKASVALWNEKPRNGSTDILHYAKHGAACSFGGGDYIATITSKAYPGENGVVTYSVEAISVENNFARGIADAISKKQHLDPSDESRILNYLVVPEIYVDGAVVSVALSERRLWSPEDPFLYDVAYEIVGAGGKVVDAGQPERGSAKLTSNPWSIIDPGPTEKWGAGKNKSMIVHVDAADGCVELRRKMFFSVGKAADAGSR